MNGNNFSNFKYRNTQLLHFLSFSLSIIIAIGWFAFNLFSPDPIWHAKQNWAFIIHHKLYIIIIYFVLHLLMIVVTIPVLYYSFLSIWSIIFGPKWTRLNLFKHIQIINASKLPQNIGRVAFFQTCCNDFIPSTLLQSLEQSYKNFDLFILDDSNNEKYIKLIDDFIKENNTNFSIKCIRRPINEKKLHPNRAGNIFYFLNNYAEEYDFILETDASAILSNDFLEKSLKYLFKFNDCGYVIGNTSMYATKNLITKPIMYEWQLMSGFRNNIYMGLFNHSLTCDGFATVYRRKILTQIPLEKVECNLDDFARGFYITKMLPKNVGIVSPLIFSGKIGAQNMQAFKVQRLKWKMADLFMWRSGLTSKLGVNKTLDKIYMWCGHYSMILGVFLTLFIAFLTNIFYFYCGLVMPNILFLIIVSITIAVPFTIFALVQMFRMGISLKMLISLIFDALLYYSIIYDVAKLVVIDTYILNKQSKFVVTNKELHQNKINVRFFHCWKYIVSLFLITGIYVVAYYEIPRPKIDWIPWSINQNIVFWISLYLPIILPNVLYILFTLFGEIQTRKGWNNKEQIDIKKHHFYYKNIEKVIY